MTSTLPDRRAQPDPERLTSAPVPVVPGQGGRAPLRVVWRQLTSMRTALLLLFLLALASVPGGFLPQRRTSPPRVLQYLKAHPVLGPFLDRLQMFDVFASVWFSAVYLLLFVSLVGCLFPRVRVHLRAVRAAPPRLPAHMGRLPVNARWESAAHDPDAVQRAARRWLRRRGWRTALRDGGLSAEKGYLRETGNLLFHVSLVVLLVGIAVGGFFGFKGTVLVKEHDAFASTVFSYDDVNPGRRFDPSRLVPFSFTLDDFRATYDDAGRALTFDADIRWRANADAPEKTKDVRVNDPLQVKGAKLYLIGHGYAPRVVVRDPAGQVAFDQTVPCLPQDAKFVSLCTVKVPDARGADGQPVQFGFEGLFTPTTIQNPKTNQVTSVHPGLGNPVLTVIGYEGDLGLDAGVPRSVYSLDKGGLRQLDPQAQALRVGDTWQMPGGGSITLQGVDEWATFQVTQDPGKRLALFASIGIVIGLMLSLFVRRRRVWVRIGPPSDEQAGTVIETGGLARNDAEAFEAEFGRFTEHLRSLATPLPTVDLAKHP